MYFVKAPTLLKKMYPNELLWSKSSEDTVYLTFDDGPHPTATPFVLNELAKFDAKATFFCIGKNVTAHDEIFQQILAAGHKVGNHSHDHLNGWKTNTEKYIENIEQASKSIESSLFRPPYGRIRKKQADRVKQMGYTIVMWDVLSGDFDTNISPEKCWMNIEQNIEPGSVIVFHDSSKALEKMQFALPLTLAYCHQRGWKMETL